MPTARDPRPQLLAYARPGTAGMPINQFAVLAIVAGTLALFFGVSLFVRSPGADKALVPLVGTALGAMIFGCIALVVGRRCRTAGIPRCLTSLGAGGLLLGAASLLLAFYALDQGLRSHETMPREKCASNLRQIGQAAELFANENGGRLPENMADFLTQDLVTACFVCPTSNDTPAAAAPTTQATAANVEAPGHCSYVYLGKDWMADELTENVVLAYEPLSNHGGLGMNVLYGDGHVDWFGFREANKLLAELNAGHNPPRLP